MHQEQFYAKKKVTFCKKENYLLQILLRELHNYLISPVAQGLFVGYVDDEGRVFIVDKSIAN